MGLKCSEVTVRYRAYKNTRLYKSESKFPNLLLLLLYNKSVVVESKEVIKLPVHLNTMIFKPWQHTVTHTHNPVCWPWNIAILPIPHLSLLLCIHPSILCSAHHRTPRLTAHEQGPIHFLLSISFEGLTNILRASPQTMAVCSALPFYNLTRVTRTYIILLDSVTITERPLKTLKYESHR